MGSVSVTVFTSDTETVTRTKLNGLAANLLSEFNGNIDNSNIKAGAGIVATKLNLATIAQNIAFTGTLDFSGATLTAATTFADLTATTVDINGGSVDGITLGTNSAVTSAVITSADINGGTLDGATIGAASPSTIKGTTLEGTTSLKLATGATVTGIADEDDMASDSATLLATQQSIKAYADTLAPISNSVFQWFGADSSQFSTDVMALYFGSDLSINVPGSTASYMYYVCDLPSATNMIGFKYKHLSSISTITIYARLWVVDGTGTLTATIGTASNTVSTTGTSPAWATTSNIDVSGLTPGTVYDSSIALNSAQDGQEVYCSAVQLISS